MLVRDVVRLGRDLRRQQSPLPSQRPDQRAEDALENLAARQASAKGGSSPQDVPAPRWRALVPAVRGSRRRRTTVRSRPWIPVPALSWPEDRAWFVHTE